MRQVVDGKLYDTEKAKLVAEASFGFPGDFEWWRERLYKTAKGAYFLHDAGGAKTKYATQVSESTMSGGAQLMPLTREAALSWCQEQKVDADIIEREFGDLVEEA